MNIKEMIKNVRDIDEKILKIVKIGVKISFLLCIIATFLLATYTVNGKLSTYYIGISLIRVSLFYIVGFIVCGIAFNNIMKDL